MSELQVDIVTPERLVYSGRASELSAPGWDGEFDILPGHSLYLSLLHGGTLVLQTPEGEKRFVVGRGFAEAGPDRVTILTDRCMAPADVDASEAKTELAAAEEELLGANAYDEAAIAGILERLEVARAVLENTH